MVSDYSDSLRVLSEIQTELRAIAQDARAHCGTRPWMPMLGCRLLHWNPDLEHFRDEPTGYIVYEPLDVRVGSRPHVFFIRVFRTNYAEPGSKRTDPGVPQRQYGITYRQFDPRSEVTRIHDAFKQCATRAGTVVKSLRQELCSCLPPQTLATANDFHRWIFTVYDVAWQAAPSDDPRSATRYIPMSGFDAAMQTSEVVPYDLNHIRSTPWRKVRRALGWKRRDNDTHFQRAYASWRERLPDYYASRIDDVLQASDRAIDWIIGQLDSPPVASDEP